MGKSTQVRIGVEQKARLESLSNKLGMPERAVIDLAVDRLFFNSRSVSQLEGQGEPEPAGEIAYK